MEEAWHHLVVGRRRCAIVRTASNEERDATVVMIAGFTVKRRRGDDYVPVCARGASACDK